MENIEDDIRDLREKNSELALEVQHWKETASQKEKEKLELMKEINDLRLKLSRLRSGGPAVARKLEAGLQSASEQALSHLVQASSAVARSLELAKQYLLEQQELVSGSPRWSTLGGTPSTEKVNRVPPLLLGGQSIQPVVSLSRATLHPNRSITRETNQNSGVTHRAVPIHMLQDVYIPLMRIDAADLQNHSSNAENIEEGDNSSDDLGLEDANDQDESMNLVSVGDQEDLEESRILEAVVEEDLEPEDEVQTPARPAADNPLEGPSWLLDVSSERIRGRPRPNFEPDSTTPDDNERETPHAFTPTVRRRKRAPERTPSPTPPSHRPARKHSGRVLKVVVAKMRLSDEDAGGAGGSSPPKRAALHSPAPPAGDVLPPPLLDPPIPNGESAVMPEANNQSQTTDHVTFTRDSNTIRQSRGNRRDNIQETRRDCRLLDNINLRDSRQNMRNSNQDLLENCQNMQDDSQNMRESSQNIQNDSQNMRDNRQNMRDNRQNMRNGNQDLRESSQNMQDDSRSMRDSRQNMRDSRKNMRDSKQDTDRTGTEMTDSDNSSAGEASEGRTRRARKNVSYKEKPLNRKMRR